MRKLRKWFSIQRNKKARLILLIYIIGFNLCLWFFSSIFVYFISPNNYSNLADALWNSGITWMLDPGFYDSNTPIFVRTIALIVIITSMITFSGGIIGYVASLFSSIIENAEKGKSKLFIYDHILILNWNSKALELIADYIYDEEVTNLVILSKYEKQDIEKQIEQKLYEFGMSNKIRMKLNILVKHGDVLSKSDLSDVCINKARSVIILSDNDETTSLDLVDMISLKTIMLIANLLVNETSKIIIELKKEETLSIIMNRIVKSLNMEDRIIPILPDEMMGCLIAQTLLFPEVNNVYEELFSFKGADFYTAPNEVKIDFINNHNMAIPIYSYGNYLYVLADNEKSISSVRPIPLQEYKRLNVSKITSNKDKTILIFGSNNKLNYILNSLKSYEIDSSSKVNCILVPNNSIESINESIKSINKIDSILILSSDNEIEKEHDTAVILTLLLIQDIAKAHKSDIIIELLDPKNYDIARNYNIRNTIISNKYVSKIITQLSKNSNLNYLFRDLLTYDDNEVDNDTYEIYTYNVEELFNLSSISFNSKSDLIRTVYFSTNEDYIVIGTVINKNTRIFSGNLDKKEEIILSKSDMLIIICK